MNHKIIIIGAGPAGLSLGHQLQILNIPFIILEKGPTAGTTWKSMPKHLRCVSPWNSNSLEIDNRGLHSSSYRMWAEEYANYLTEFSTKFNLPIQLNTTVNSVEHNNNGYKLSTNQGDLEATNVIWAGGHFENPNYPSYYQQLKSELPCFHFKDFGSIPKLKEQGYKNILVVGKRLSAGQLIVECLDNDVDCSISIRSELKFTSSPAVFNFFFRNILKIEGIMLALMGNKKFEADVKMESGREKEAIESGKVKVYKDVVNATGNTIQFEEEQKADFDAVIFATGFSPNLGPIKSLEPDFIPSKLKGNFESPVNRGLFFLGFSSQVNYRSRFLRGMREDAKGLAVILRERTCQ